jgi:hypothetical protein
MAASIASFIIHLWDDGSVTCSGVSRTPERTEHAQAVETVQTAAPGAVVESDPWAAAQPMSAPLTGVAAPAPTTWPAPAPAVAAQSAPSCAHGVRRFVPAGVSKTGVRAGQPYNAFWACPADRNDPSKCKTVPAS